MDNKIKRAAAFSAVIQYIKSEQEVQMARQTAISPAAPVQRASFSGLWATSGRQYQMQMRNLMQIKSFHGACLR